MSNYSRIVADKHVSLWLDTNGFLPVLELETTFVACQDTASGRDEMAEAILSAIVSLAKALGEIRERS